MADAPRHDDRIDRVQKGLLNLREEILQLSDDLADVLARYKLATELHNRLESVRERLGNIDLNANHWRRLLTLVFEPTDNSRTAPRSSPGRSAVSPMPPEPTGADVTLADQATAHRPARRQP